MFFCRVEDLFTLDDDAADGFMSLNFWLEATVSKNPPLETQIPWFFLAW